MNVVKGKKTLNRVTYKCGCEIDEVLYEDGKGNKDYKKLCLDMPCRKCFNLHDTEMALQLVQEAVIKDEK